MSEPKFTPGPWAVNQRKDNPEIWWTGGMLIAGIVGCAEFDFANAHLVAAAPDLYESLSEIVALTDRKTDIWDKAHAALAKARGEA
jgi:hypothetical protein